MRARVFLLTASALLGATLAACDSDGTDDAEIVRYDGPAITQADASVPNPPFGSAAWMASAPRRGAIDVAVTTLCGDECGRTIRFSFRESTTAEPLPLPGPLPESVTGTVSVQEYLPERFETAEIEVTRVEIQDWGPEIYSGIVYPAVVLGDFSPVVPFVFWAEIARPDARSPRPAGGHGQRGR